MQIRNTFYIVNSRGHRLDFDGTLTTIGEGATFTNLSDIDKWADEIGMEMRAFDDCFNHLTEVPYAYWGECKWFNTVSVFAVEYQARGFGEWWWRKTVKGWAVEDDGEWVLNQNLVKPSL